MGNKFKLEFDGMDKMIKELEQLGGSLKDTTEAALKQTYGLVTSSVKSAVGASSYNFNRTGRTKASIVGSPMVEWNGVVASVPVGFDISNGGLPSIFLMHGTPRITPDRNVYNSIFGTKIRNTVRKEQANVFQKRIERSMK